MYSKKVYARDILFFFLAVSLGSFLIESPIATVVGTHSALQTQRDSYKLKIQTDLPDAFWNLWLATGGVVKGFISSFQPFRSLAELWVNQLCSLIGCLAK
jgi:hypothetical protein